MKHNTAIAAALVALLSPGLASFAVADEIDTLTGSNPVDFPGDVAFFGDVIGIGGTFVANDVNLAAFTIRLGEGGGGPDSVRAVVRATELGPFPAPDLGAPPDQGDEEEEGPGLEGPPVFNDVLDVRPIDPPLFISAPFDVIGAPSDYLFMPNVALTPGLKYWIGIDVLTLNGSIEVAYFLPPEPASGFVFVIPPGAWAHESSIDLGSIIVTNPEPGSAALFGLGLLSAAVLRRRRRRAASA